MDQRGARTGGTLRGSPRAPQDDDRGRVRHAAARVPGHLDLEDPLPRGPEAAVAAPHAGRVPALLHRRRVATAHDPAPAARRVPAAAGDPPGAGGRAHRAGAERGLRRRHARRGAWRSRAAPTSAIPSTTCSSTAARTSGSCGSWRSTGCWRADGTGAKRFDAVEREIVRTAAELSRFGVAARNLRVLRTSADREAVLIEQILGPALRSRNRDRRREAVDTSRAWPPSCPSSST